MILIFGFVVEWAFLFNKNELLLLPRSFLIMDGNRMNTSGIGFNFYHKLIFKVPILWSFLSELQIFHPYTIFAVSLSLTPSLFLMSFSFIAQNINTKKIYIFSSKLCLCHWNGCNKFKLIILCHHTLTFFRIETLNV